MANKKTSKSFQQLMSIMGSRQPFTTFFFLDSWCTNSTQIPQRNFWRGFPELHQFDLLFFLLKFGYKIARLARHVPQISSDFSPKTPVAYVGRGIFSANVGSIVSAFTFEPSRAGFALDEFAVHVALCCLQNAWGVWNWSGGNGGKHLLCSMTF